MVKQVYSIPTVIQMILATEVQTISYLAQRKVAIIHEYIAHQR